MPSAYITTIQLNLPYTHKVEGLIPISTDTQPERLASSNQSWLKALKLAKLIGYPYLQKSRGDMSARGTSLRLTTIHSAKNGFHMQAFSCVQLFFIHTVGDIHYCHHLVPVRMPSMLVVPSPTLEAPTFVSTHCSTWPGCVQQKFGTAGRFSHSSFWKLKNLQNGILICMSIISGQWTCLAQYVRSGTTEGTCMWQQEVEDLRQTMR